MDQVWDYLLESPAGGLVSVMASTLAPATFAAEFPEYALVGTAGPAAPPADTVLSATQWGPAFVPISGAPPGQTPGGRPAGHLPLELSKGSETTAFQGGTMEELDALLRDGWRITNYAGKRGAGEPLHTMLYGGWLIDSHPLNVLTGQGWIEGQLEVLAPYVESGQVAAPFLMLNAPQIPPEAAGFDQNNWDVFFQALDDRAEGVTRPVVAGYMLPGAFPWSTIAIGAGAGLVTLAAASRLRR